MLLLKQHRVPLIFPRGINIRVKRLKAFSVRVVSAICVTCPHLTQMEQVRDDTCIFLLLVTAKEGPAVKESFKSFKSTEELRIKR